MSMLEPLPDLLDRFDELQRKLVPLWEHIGRSDPGSLHIEEANTVVVLPSLPAQLGDFPTQQGYEERMLFMLFLLRQPRIRLVYLSSVPVPEEVIDYYLDVMPSVAIDNARRRLFLVSPHDASTRPLTDKILERPALMDHIRSLIPDIHSAHLVPFMTTDSERELAVRLDLPMYAADPRFEAFGTKSGCRRLFEELGLPHPIGREDLAGPEDLVRAIAEMRRQKPEIARLVVKHNRGVSGFGNAQLDLAGLPAPGSAGENSAITGRLPDLAFELAGVTYEGYMQELSAHGGIVEEMIIAPGLVSPSAQLRITPLQEVELLSTHDQMLGGPTGQIYLGARFPANPAYGPKIMRQAQKIGRRLAREGVVGRFAVDFLAAPQPDGSWDTYAIEINLRKGGTTHPFLTLQYLTDGKYDTESGIFYTALGQPKAYVATDTLKDQAYRVFCTGDLFDLVSDHRLHYNHTTQTGVVLHMFSQVASLGKIGLTAIGDSAEHAESIYQCFIDLLNETVVKYQSR